MEYLAFLYHTYIHESLPHKIFQIIVLITILVSLFGLIFGLLGYFSHAVEMIHKYSLVILIVFIIELLFDFLYFEDSKEFVKKHWIDVLLVIILSLTFFTTYLGAAKWIKYVKNIKSIRISSKLFK